MALKTTEELGEYYEEVKRTDYVLIYRHKSSKSKSVDFDAEGYCRHLLPYIQALQPDTTLLRDTNDGKLDAFLFGNGLVIRPTFNYHQMTSEKISFSSHYPAVRKLDGWTYSNHHFPDAGVSMHKHPVAVAKEVIKRVYQKCEESVKNVDELYAKQEKEKQDLSNFADVIAARFPGISKFTCLEGRRKYRYEIKAGKRTLAGDLVGTSIYLDGFGIVSQTQLSALFDVISKWES